MSEAMIIPPLADAETKRTPTVYFIDDSATMREVIKIAFRRENINIIACPDAASALAQFEQNPPDAVITDVIMPDQDGYSVCTQIKQHPLHGSTPVVLMSGVVNKSVADKAVSVGADELIRKPFQPQDLIARVRTLLGPKSLPTAPAPTTDSLHALSSLFAPAPSAPPPPRAVPSEQKPTDSVWPRALAEAFIAKSATPAPPPDYVQPSAPPAVRQPTASDMLKLRGEIARLELLVKKLQTELQIERQYNQALETQIHTLTQTEQ
jgi:CheY-like chemotaxis protein